MVKTKLNTGLGYKWFVFSNDSQQDTWLGLIHNHIDNPD
jgi:hypothetical protein